MTTSSDRWRTAIHEAGHAIAGHELGGRCVGLALREDGGLASVYDLHGSTFAYMVAAGPAAEYLATKHPAPEMPPADVITREPIDPADSEASRFEFAVARAAIQPTHYQSDARSIALWAITSHEDDPDSWSRRVRFARHVADEIVERNVDRIVRLASELFIRGRLSRVEIESLLNGA